MKKLNAVRWAAFLNMLVVNADTAMTQMADDRPIIVRPGKCERCGQTGPTVPIAPVVFRARPTGGAAVVLLSGNAGLAGAVQNVRSTSAIPVLDEFMLDSARPALGAVLIR